MRFSFVILAFLLTACGNRDLPEYTRLGPLRVLSIKANPPEVAPGGTTTLTPFVSDLNGGGRTLSYRIEACVDPGLKRGADPTCSGVSTQNIGSGTITPGTPASFSAPNYTGAVTSFSVTVPSDILTSQNPVDQANGVDYLVFYELSTSDGSVLKSMKRIRASGRTTQNTNPILTSILSNGVALTSLPSGSVNLTAPFQSGSQETFTYLKSDGSTATGTETLTTSWFISDGSIDYTSTLQDSSNGYAPPDTRPSSHAVLIVAVGRDGRGGEDVLKLEL